MSFVFALFIISLSLYKIINNGHVLCVKFLPLLLVDLGVLSPDPLNSKDQDKATTLPTRRTTKRALLFMDDYPSSPISPSSGQLAKNQTQSPDSPQNEGVLHPKPLPPEEAVSLVGKDFRIRFANKLRLRKESEAASMSSCGVHTGPGDSIVDPYPSSSSPSVSPTKDTELLPSTQTSTPIPSYDPKAASNFVRSRHRSQLSYLVEDYRNSGLLDKGADDAGKGTNKNEKNDYVDVGLGTIRML